jgi:hypothetical protein
MVLVPLGAAPRRAHDAAADAVWVLLLLRPVQTCYGSSSPASAPP